MCESCYSLIVVGLVGEVWSEGSQMCTESVLVRVGGEEGGGGGDGE